jgi:hypothetical protein
MIIVELKSDMMELLVAPNLTSRIGHQLQFGPLVIFGDLVPPPRDGEGPGVSHLCFQDPGYQLVRTPRLGSLCYVFDKRCCRLCSYVLQRCTRHEFDQC